jgi:hypothetical protein
MIVTFGCVIFDILLPKENRNKILIDKFFQLKTFALFSKLLEYNLISDHNLYEYYSCMVYSHNSIDYALSVDIRIDYLDGIKYFFDNSGDISKVINNTSMRSECLNIIVEFTDLVNGDLVVIKRWSIDEKLLSIIRYAKMQKCNRFMILQNKGSKIINLLAFYKTDNGLFDYIEVIKSKEEIYNYGQIEREI